MVSLKKWWRTATGTLRGAVWMILAGACFAGLGVTIRLSAADIDILEVIFFRNFFNLILMFDLSIKVFLLFRLPYTNLYIIHIIV